MANDPRTFLVKPCPVNIQRRSTAAARKKGFLDNITKIGDLEFLNDIGGGDIGRGLRTLSAVSDSVRTGESVVPGREGTDTYNSTLGKIAGTAIDAVDKGANVVLDTCGLGGAVDTVGKLNTGAANRAYGQAKTIYDRVKKGNFELEDIPEVFSDLQNLETLARGIFGGSGTPQTRSRELCGATPYARDLIAFAPKFQFMFIIEIDFAPEYNDWNANASQVAFVIKTSTRPKFNVDYEDINMYGFRTRVPKRVEYQPMAMSFYDDNKNAAHKFYVSYMRAMSPIANWKNRAPQDGQYEQSGMDYQRGADAATFTKTSPKTLGHSASLGPLLNKTTSLIKEMRLHHIFDYGNKMSTYHFYNPRITTFSPSDLTMLESGEGGSFDFEFMYDGLFIDHMVDLEKYTTKLKDLTERHGQRPIDPVYASSTTGQPEPDGGKGEPDADQAEDDAPKEGFLGGFGEGLKSAADGVTDAFGNIIGGVSTAAGAVSNQINTVIGDAQDAYAEISKGVAGAINQGIAAGQKAIGGLGDTISNAFKAEDTLAKESAAVNDVFDATSDSKKANDFFYI